MPGDGATDVDWAKCSHSSSAVFAESRARRARVQLYDPVRVRYY